MRIGTACALIALIGSTAPLAAEAPVDVYKDTCFLLVLGDFGGKHLAPEVVSYLTGVRAGVEIAFSDGKVSPRESDDETYWSAMRTVHTACLANPELSIAAALALGFAEMGVD